MLGPPSGCCVDGPSPSVQGSLLPLQNKSGSERVDAERHLKLKVMFIQSLEGPVHNNLVFASSGLLISAIRLQIVKRQVDLSLSGTDGDAVCRLARLNSKERKKCGVTLRRLEPKLRVLVQNQR